MGQTRAELKAKLMAEADVLIEELLDWNAETPAPNLTQVEEVILKLRKRLGEQAAMALLESQAAVRPVPGPMCAECRQEMHYKGKRRHHVESRVGALSVARGYYYCEQCGRSVFPPG